MSRFDELIQKHRANGLLMDANLLVLYLVGRTNKRRIEKFKRTQTYTVEDFELLEVIASNFGRLITTPHLLTEVSNLAALHGDELHALRSRMTETVEQMQEFYDESRLVVRDPIFKHLGLADAAVATVCRHSFLVLTDDLNLFDGLNRRGVDAINFNHIRTYYWNL